MGPGIRRAVALAFVFAFVPLVSAPADALCHSSMACKAYLPDGTCVTYTDIVFHCGTNDSHSSDDGTGITTVNLETSGILAVVTATPVAPGGSSTAFSAGSMMTVSIATQWIGNASHAASLTVVYEFGTGGVEWLSPPGVYPGGTPTGTASDEKQASVPALETDTHATYTASFTDFEEGSTLAWSFRIPDGRTEGTVHMPVTVYVVEGNEAQRDDDALAFPVEPASSVAVPVQPIWQAPMFLLVVGAAVGLAIGFVLFRKRTT